MKALLIGNDSLQLAFIENENRKVFWTHLGASSIQINLRLTPQVLPNQFATVTDCQFQRVAAAALGGGPKIGFLSNMGVRKRAVLKGKVEREVSLVRAICFYRKLLGCATQAFGR
ncbi:hypothetical protein Q31a_24440 [Aureliella helgolandensis]|uniref:Uncharacterized protein n=1 Tax=Aureliella helgolandensis TaxID=2527968 RepID=A0A518G6B8_9BACT|nr:hypothetical protein Q31a_24440 [Aureliella helgolandensis]